MYRKELVLDLKQNYFALFSLPISFEVETTVLTENYRALQQAMHPDKFAAATPQEKRYSMQASSLINEAYQTLSSDLKRAVYILQLNEIDVDTETDTKVDPMFLMTQMKYREQLEAIPQTEDPFAAADAMRESITGDVGALNTSVSNALQQEDFAVARDTVRKWQFLEKLKQELSELEHRLEDQLDI